MTRTPGPRDPAQSFGDEASSKADRQRTGPDNSGFRNEADRQKTTSVICRYKISSRCERHSSDSSRTRTSTLHVMLFLKRPGFATVARSLTSQSERFLFDVIKRPTQLRTLVTLTI